MTSPDPTDHNAAAPVGAQPFLSVARQAVLQSGSPYIHLIGPDGRLHGRFRQNDRAPEVLADDLRRWLARWLAATAPTAGPAVGSKQDQAEVQ